MVHADKHTHIGADFRDQHSGYHPIDAYPEFAVIGHSRSVTALSTH